MSNPFHVFRRHQRWMMAGLGLVAMLAFGLNLDSCTGHRPGAANAAVVSTRYGQITESELHRVVQMHRILKYFLGTAFQVSGGNFTRMHQPIVEFSDSMAEQSAVETIVAAHRAEEMGFVVSDDMIKHYLAELTDNRLDASQLRQILEGRQIDGSPVTVGHVFDGLRREILAERYRSTYIGATAVTPLLHWTHYLELNDKVNCQVVDVPVEKFIDKAPEPTEAEIEEMYQKYKDQEKPRQQIPGVGVVEAPAPGFKVPRRITLQSATLDLVALTDKLAMEIPAAEVAKYYEDHKRDFVRAHFLDEDTTVPDKAAPPEPAEEPADGPAEPPATPPTGEAPKTPATGEAPATPPVNEPALGSPSAEKPATPPAPETPAPATPGAEKPATPPAAEAPKSSLSAPAISTQFVLLQDQPPAEAPAATPAAEVPAAIPPAAEVPAAIPPAAEGPAGTPPAATPPGAAATEKGPDGKPVAPPAAGDKASPPVEYRPLSEVEDGIRRTIAQSRAADLRTKAQQAIFNEMQTYSVARRQKVNQLELGPDGKRAPIPDSIRQEDQKAMAKIAESAIKAGLEVNQTKALSGFDFRDTALGKSYTADGAPLLYYYFANSTLNREFIPQQSIDAETGDGYVTWEINDQATYVPDLKDIRTEVIRACKIVQARLLAKAEADKIAATVSGKKISLDAALSGSKEFAGYTASPTSPFSRWTLGDVPRGQNSSIKLGEIDGVEGVDEKFLEKIFALSDGEAMVDFNIPQTSVYVVQLENHTSTPEALREQFLRRPGPWKNVAEQDYRGRVRMAIYDDLQKNAQIKWERPADEHSQE